MRRATVVANEFDSSEHVGAVLCRDLVVQADGKTRQFRRGSAASDVVSALDPDQQDISLHILVPEPGDVTQERASEMLANAICGDGVYPREPHQGQVDVHSTTFGVLRIDPVAVSQLNEPGTALIATGLDGRVVDADETVAIVKASELLVASNDVASIVEGIGVRRPICVAPFIRTRVALIAGERIREPNLNVSSKHLAAGLERFGAQLVDVRRSNDTSEEIARHYHELLRDNVELVLVAGSIVLDPQDPYLSALEHVDARLIRRGAPIDPGTMFWVAYAGDVPFFGLASCEMYGKLSIFDLFLPYALACEPITNELISQLGYGGLLNDTQIARRPRSWRTS